MELMPHLKLPDNLGGTIIGGICGAANNLIYGFTTGDSITLVYALTSLGIGIAVGIMAQSWQNRKLRSEGRTVLAILHDMDFVAENFERVIVMAHGQVLADGTREEVFAQEEVLKKARIEQPYMTRLCSLLGYEKLYFGGI